jgi:peroxiredoxin (alkyl hydroperoxide reductase subunit C)
MNAKLSIKAFFAVIFMFLTVIPALVAGGKYLEVGETIPNPEFYSINRYELDKMPRTIRLHDYKQDKILLLAIMPDISAKNPYSRVMTSAFDTYFAEQMAFIKNYSYDPKANDVMVLVVSNNDEAEIREFLAAEDLDFEMASDINMDFANFFGINKWEENSASHVYVINKDNKIAFADSDYKGQGEKLKLVQKELSLAAGMDISSDPVLTDYSPLMPGDNARDFGFTYLDKDMAMQYSTLTQNGRLSDYFGKKNIVIAFYPAPFSMSCAMEVSKFDSFAEESGKNYLDNINGISGNDIEILMVSMSNTSIISKWRDDMNLKNVTMISDITGEISSMYSSFNPLGYNNRTVFLIDRSGKVAFIDWDYKVDEQDFAALQDQIEKLD